jgi:hypothetical protein
MHEAILSDGRSGGNSMLSVLLSFLRFFAIFAAEKDGPFARLRSI